MERALNFASEDCIYRLNVSDASTPFGGVTVGRTAILQAMIETRRVFEYVLYRPLSFADKGPIVRSRTEFIYRHRASGEMLNGYIRHVFKVEGGQFVEADEFHDAPMAEAFLRLFPWQPETSDDVFQPLKETT